MAKLILKSGLSTFELEIGTETHIDGAHISLHAGGSSYKAATSVYEADKGYIILEAMPKIESQWGQSTYTTSLTGREANVEKIEKLTQNFDELIARSKEEGNEKNAEKIEWTRKQILDYYFKYTSSNARFEVSATAQSREIKALGVVIDTKTANIKMSFSFRILKLVTPEEAQLIQQFFKAALDNGSEIEVSYS